MRFTCKVTYIESLTITKILVGQQEISYGEGGISNNNYVPTAQCASVTQINWSSIQLHDTVCVFQARFLSHIQGDAYQSNLVSEDDCEAKLKDVQSGILKAFEYHQGETVRLISIVWA